MTIRIFFKNYRRYWMILSVLTLIVAISGVLSTIRTRKQAETLIYKIQLLKPGESTFAEVQKLATEYRGTITGKTCDASQCQFYFYFENTWLKSIRIAPGTLFTV